MKTGVCAYAKHRGVTRQAVNKAITTGRLEKSLTRNGKRWKIDFAAADREWLENTDPTRGAWGGPPTDTVEQCIQAFQEALLTDTPELLLHAAGEPEPLRAVRAQLQRSILAALCSLEDD